MKKTIIIAVAVALAAAGGWYYWQQQQKGKLPDYISQSNGRLELNRIDVSSLYAGRVKKMLVDEGSEVKAGDVLAQLSSETSSSKLEAAKSQKKRAEETVSRADAEITSYQQQQKVAQMELNNAQSLRSDSLISDSELTKRRAARDAASAALQAARAAKAEAQAAVSTAQAQINEVSSVNNDMDIRSPIAGRVEYKIAEVGNVIGAGNKVISLLDPTDVYMNVFLPTEAMSRLKVGDDARIKLDGIDAVFPAKIKFIAADAQFTPKSVETTTERAKLMFKVKLQVPVDTALKYNRLLKGGLAGNGYVNTDNQKKWPSELDVKLPH